MSRTHQHRKVNQNSKELNQRQLRVQFQQRRNKQELRLAQLNLKQLHRE